ncbi:hypothetical protein HQ524_00945 [Candidatus Uhrbacteria bacterium]|nr:hypothetical protein [Candidatus Uhrbacteria bacterium]
MAKRHDDSNAILKAGEMPGRSAGTFGDLIGELDLTGLKLVDRSTAEQNKKSKKNNPAPVKVATEETTIMSNPTGTQRGAVRGLAVVADKIETTPAAPVAKAPAATRTPHLARKAAVRKAKSTHVMLDRDETDKVHLQMQAFGVQGNFPVSNRIEMTMTHDRIEVAQGKFKITIVESLIASVVMMIQLVTKRLGGLTTRSEGGITVSIVNGFLKIQVTSTPSEAVVDEIEEIVEEETVAEVAVVEKETVEVAPKVEVKAIVPEPEPEVSAEMAEALALAESLGEASGTGPEAAIEVRIREEAEAVRKARREAREARQKAEREAADAVYEAERKKALKWGRKNLRNIFGTTRKGSKKLIEGCVIEGQLRFGKIIELHKGCCSLTDESCKGKAENVTIIGEFKVGSSSFNLCGWHNVAAKEVRDEIRNAPFKKAREAEKAEKQKAFEAKKAAEREAQEAQIAELDQDTSWVTRHAMNEEGLQMWSLDDVLGRPHKVTGVPFIYHEEMNGTGRDPLTGEEVVGANGFLIHAPYDENGKRTDEPIRFRPVSRKTFELVTKHGAKLPKGYRMCGRWEMVNFVKEVFGTQPKGYAGGAAQKPAAKHKGKAPAVLTAEEQAKRAKDKKDAREMRRLESEDKRNSKGFGEMKTASKKPESNPKKGKGKGRGKGDGK